MSHVETRPQTMVRPLRQCVLRCDPYLRLIEGGTYGYTRGGGKQFHGGVDLYAEPGTPCYAMYRGAVEWFHDFGDSGWGKALLTRLDFPGWRCWTLYAHLSRVDVKGGPLDVGTPLGLTGISGNGDSRYPHLHFETWRSMQAGEAGTFERYRFDPLYLLGTLPFQPFAAEVIARNERLARTA
jgi:murein DD-endopeptidase MepM/ murein hydrolase activator NlpD